MLENLALRALKISARRLGFSTILFCRETRMLFASFMQAQNPGDTFQIKLRSTAIEATFIGRHPKKGWLFSLGNGARVRISNVEKMIIRKGRLCETVH